MDAIIINESINIANVIIFGIIAVVLLTLSAMAQEPYKVYCSIWSTASSNPIGYVYIDYGQENSNRNWLVDEDGKGIGYNSFIQVINYLARYGWALENNMVIPTFSILDDKRMNGSKQLFVLSKAPASNVGGVVALTVTLVSLLQFQKAY